MMVCVSSNAGAVRGSCFSVWSHVRRNHCLWSTTFCSTCSCSFLQVPLWGSAELLRRRTYGDLHETCGFLRPSGTSWETSRNDGQSSRSTRLFANSDPVHICQSRDDDAFH